MPTENRRIAAYLPKEIDDRFAAFKAERGIKGDSQALIVVLSEFLGVAQQVAYSVEHQSNFATKSELSELNLKVAHLMEQIREFDLRLTKVSGVTSELKSELLNELPKQNEAIEISPGQLELLKHQIDDQEPELLPQVASIPSELLKGLSTRALESRFKEGGKASRKAITSRKESPEFPAWSAAQDPDGIAWEYREDTKQYHPVK